ITSSARATSAAGATSRTRVAAGRLTVLSACRTASCPQEGDGGRRACKRFPLLMLWPAPPRARECLDVGAVLGSHHLEELSMQSISTIGLDIAKSAFQVHGVDAAGQVVVRRQLRRRHVLAFFQNLPPSLVGIEACASSHHWSRELQALGHTVRL